MQQARNNEAAGLHFVEPLEVLIEQNCAQFELFTGHPAPEKLMTDCLLRQYRAMNFPSDVKHETDEEME